MFKCVYQMNFLNSPPTQFNPTEHCEAVKNFLESNTKCGHKYEDTFIVDWSFWKYFMVKDDNSTSTTTTTIEP